MSTSKHTYLSLATAPLKILLGRLDSIARSTGLIQRFQPKTVSFLLAVLALLLIDQQADSLGRMRFSRILVQDSSQLRMIAITLTKPFFLGMERVAGWLSQSLTFLRSLDEILDYDLRHFIHDKRKRKNTQGVEYQTRRLKLTRMGKGSKIRPLAKLPYRNDDSLNHDFP